MLRPVPCSALSEPSIAPDNDVRDLVHERGVAADRFVVGKALGEHEVQIAVERMAEDDGLGIAVFDEGSLKIGSCSGEVLDRHGDVFDNDCRADGPSRRRPPEKVPCESSKIFRSDRNPSRIRQDARAACRAARATQSATFASTSASSAPCISTSSAVASDPRLARKSGIPGLPVTDANPARSISSTAATGSCFSRVTAWQADTSVSKNSSAQALWRYSGTVRYAISEMKPSVPSDPIIRCWRMSNGSSKSTSALSE